ALPLLSGSAWKEMHTDKAMYVSCCLSLISLLESGVERSMALPLSLVKLLEDFSGGVEEWGILL
ncbi:hypothetical protein Tco_1390884, partial [Tanacetum coccineum]